MRSPFLLLTHFTSIFNYSLTFCIILHAFLLKRLNVYRRFSPRSQSSPLFRRCCRWFFISARLSFFLSRISIWRVCVWAREWRMHSLHVQTHWVLLFLHSSSDGLFFLFLCTMSGDIMHIFTQTQRFTYFININLNTYRFATLVSFVCSLFILAHSQSWHLILFAFPWHRVYDVRRISLQTHQIGRLLLCIQIIRRCRRGCCRYSTPPLCCSRWSVLLPFAWNKLNLRKETERMGQQEQRNGSLWIYLSTAREFGACVCVCVCVNMQNVHRE